MNDNKESDNNNSSFFNDKPKLPPLDERTDDYSRTKQNTDKLIEIYKRLNN